MAQLSVCSSKTSTLRKAKQSLFEISHQGLAIKDLYLSWQADSMFVSGHSRCSLSKEA